MTEALYSARHILALTDLTFLNSTDTPSSIALACDKLLQLKDILGEGPFIPAICVFPVFVDPCKQKMHALGVKVAAVAGAFPHGQLPLHLKLDELRYVIDNGADEVDYVFPISHFLQGNFNEVVQELDAVRAIASNKTLKVIIESGELKTIENIVNATKIVIECGAEFVKTSTGKTATGATPEAAGMICETILKNGSKTGIKISGGVKDIKTATAYIQLAERYFSSSFINPSRFRFGASALVNDLLRDMMKEKGRNDIIAYF